MKYDIAELNKLLNKLNAFTFPWVPESCQNSVNEEIAYLHGDIQELFYKVSKGE